MRRGFSFIDPKTDKPLLESSNGRNIPVTVGKLSLRKRLEDYYSLVAPNTIANEAEWKQKFDLIYSKYGGSEKGEMALMAKLCKKYGSTVRLMVAKTKQIDTRQKMTTSSEFTMDESSYQVQPEFQNSGILDFTSEKFDAFAAIRKDFVEVSEANPFIKDATFLDNISKFTPYLPRCDPLYRPTPTRKANSLESQKESSNILPSTEVMKKKIPVFTSLASFHQSGPMSFLYFAHLKRERIRVLIRYVDSIRGTLTGYVIAFDKHMNLLLKDVDEVFTNRMTQVFYEDSTENNPEALSNLELEMNRRKLLMKTENIPNTHKVGKRHFQQLLVRGDNVVSIWKADAEEKTTKLDANE